MPDITTILAQGAVPLFEGLAAPDVERLVPQLHRRTVPAGATIMNAEAPGEAAYIVVSGTVKVQVEQADGGAVILALLGPGALVGELSLLEDIGRSATVVTLEQSELLWMSRSAFRHLLDTMPAINRNLVRLLARRIRLADAHIQTLASQDVFGRVARQLLALAEVYGEPGPDGGRHIPLRLTQSDLADLAGASRVRVNQALVAYREQGYIAVDARHHVTIHNAAALERRCR